MFYSKSTGGFYDAAIHGNRTIGMPDPAWQRPRSDVELQPGEAAVVEVDGKLQTVENTTNEPMLVVGAMDMQAAHPFVDVSNPDCRIPSDAVAITADQHQALIEGQAAGKVIAADADGFPVLQDPPPPPPADPKMVGVEFDGVMCSATTADAAGLLQVKAGIELMGAEFKTKFAFANGNKLWMSASNFKDFMRVWVPFRNSFFAPEN